MFLIHEKKGYETNRLGGSAGANGASLDQLKYFQAHRGSFPNIAGAVVHLSKDNGTWHAYYITPYSRSKEKMVAVYPYSTPKPGGQINWEKELDHIYPFFLTTCQRFDQQCPVFLFQFTPNVLLVFPLLPFRYNKCTITVRNMKPIQRRMCTH
jgi:hypothetical protein